MVAHAYNPRAPEEAAADQEFKVIFSCVGSNVKVMLRYRRLRKEGRKKEVIYT